MTTPVNPPDAKAGQRPLTPQEEIQRHAAAACSGTSALACEKDVHVGIFFDGTNNNMERDKAESPPSHSNVVTLFETYKNAPGDGYYRFYVPGVGTKFIEIGEPTEDDDAKAYGKGGDQRINWALIQVVNAIHRAVFDDRPLLAPYDAGVEAGLWPLYVVADTGAGRREKRMYFTGEDLSGNQQVYQREKNEKLGWRIDECEQRKKTLDKRKANHNLSKQDIDAIEQEKQSLDQRVAALQKYRRSDAPLKPLLERLKTALRRKPNPKVRLVNVSVFGFSRGAAQARAFCTFLQDILTAEGQGFFEKLRGKDATGYALAGIPLRVQFMGLFDTVASAGMADASPFWRGFGGWANGTMDIPACVERTAHYIAGHELRLAFPSSSIRLGATRYPKNSVEVVYPGAHSNVGGGYNPGCQGKSRAGRSSLLSQIPLSHMYKEARLWGVPLQGEAELRSGQGAAALQDMQIADETARLHDAYVRQCAVPLAPAEDMMKRHTQVYWRWREQKSPNAQFAALDSYRGAPAQDRQDLWESEQDYRADRELALGAFKAGAGHGRADLNNPADLDYGKALAWPPVSKEMSDFFDKLVHDSHATFYMVGPTTALDRRDIYEKVVEKNKEGTKLSAVEQRILQGKGVWPVLTDADTKELMAHMALYKRGALTAVRQSTRREMGGHIHYRRVFDAS